MTNNKNVIRDYVRLNGMHKSLTQNNYLALNGIVKIRRKKRTKIKESNRHVQIILKNHVSN